VEDYNGATTTVIDSYDETPNRYGTDSNIIEIILRERINVNYAYTIELKKLGLKYKLSGFALKRKVCDDCILNKKDWTNYIGGYNLNGVYREQEKIIIHR
jgi:hypothetical protein